MLQKNDGQNKSGALPRMDISELIAAKRRNLKKSKSEKENDEEEDATASLSSVEQSESEKGVTSDDDHSENDGSDDGESQSGNSSDTSDGSSSDDEDDEVDDVHAAGEDMEADALKTRAGREETHESDSDESGSDSDAEDKEETAKAAAFYDTKASSAPQEDVVLFAQLTLSRPLLRGIAAMGFVRPTPIQSSVIPVALAGRDVCASAVTGSGKTAAFVLPIVERIMRRQIGGIKGVILTPTRELAAQCVGMISTFTQYTKVRSCLIVGGAKNVNAQVRTVGNHIKNCLESSIFVDFDRIVLLISPII